MARRLLATLTPLRRLSGNSVTGDHSLETRAIARFTPLLERRATTTAARVAGKNMERHRYEGFAGATAWLRNGATN